MNWRGYIHLLTDAVLPPVHCQVSDIVCHISSQSKDTLLLERLGECWEKTNVKRSLTNQWQVERAECLDITSINYAFMKLQLKLEFIFLVFYEDGHFVCMVA